MNEKEIAELLDNDVEFITKLHRFYRVTDGKYRMIVYDEDRNLISSEEITWTDPVVAAKHFLEIYNAKE